MANRKMGANEKRQVAAALGCACCGVELEEQGMSAPSLAYLMGWEGLQVAGLYSKFIQAFR